MESYKRLIFKVMDKGEIHEDRTGVGTKSVFGADFEHDMRQGFPLLTTKKVHFKSVIAELLWFLSGSSDNAALNAMGCTIWDDWATEEKCAKFNRKANDLGHIYGPLMRNYDNLSYVRGGLRDNPELASTSFDPAEPLFFNDQIAGLMFTLRNEPQSRRHMVQLWHAGYARTVELPPCHYGFQVKCHDTTGISLKVTMRSADLFLGVPFNIASYATLLVALGKITNREPRDLKMSFGDLHVYKNHFKQIDIQMQRECRPLPTLEVDKDFTSTSWEDDLSNLVSLEPENFKLLNYNPHSAIKGEVAV